MRVTRRECLQLGAAGLTVASLDLLRANPLRALAATPGQLSDIEHFVIVIQENRSFDHYFGTFAGVRGWADPAMPAQAGGRSIMYQPDSGQTAAAPKGFLLPFHLNTTTSNASCQPDITHEWADMHHMWNDGRLDRFATVHRQIDPGPNGEYCMGYFTRDDLPYYAALADAFTVCDAYHCSVLGPTDPNRLYSMTGTVDPEGKNGGPLLKTPTTNRLQNRGIFNWTTYPEQLQARGITWKFYSTADGDYGDNTMLYFKNFQDPASPLFQNAFLPTFPGTFQADVAADRAGAVPFPQVAWVVSSLVAQEHPPGTTTAGEQYVHQILATLWAHPALWAKTAVILTYDENGGVFDHVPPPVPPPGTPGEWVTATPAITGPSILGSPPVYGPVGLGFRVPTIIISPFSRGGLVCSDTFDHTSLLRLLEARFGAEVPNLSAWRRATVGDLTSAFNFAAGGDASLPALPTPETDYNSQLECSQTNNGASLFGSGGTAYPIPDPQSLPTQQRGSRARPSGPVAASASRPGAGQGSTLLPNTSAAHDDHTLGLALAGGVAAAGLAALGAAIRLRERDSAAAENDDRT